jgi:hypothetical protein
MYIMSLDLGGKHRDISLNNSCACLSLVCGLLPAVFTILNAVAFLTFQSMKSDELFRQLFQCLIGVFALEN